MPHITAKTDILGKIGRKEQLLGVFISSMDPTSTEVMADAGFDFVVLDGEHGKCGRREVEDHVRAANQRGIIPFTRVLENSPALIQSVLDAGAHGVVVPHIDTAEQARAAVAASLYAPRGRRGMCNACYAGAYDLDAWPAHVARSDENVMVFPLIESRRAVENVEEIVAVDGIDIIFFGPGDLSAEMGLDFVRDRAALEECWVRVRDATRAAGKHLLTPMGMGYDDGDMLIAPMDWMLLLNGSREIVQKYRALG